MYIATLHALLVLSALAAESGTAEEVLKKINAARKQAGVPPVVLDKKLSQACQAHADYLIRHFDPARAASFNPHMEDPGLPGYTKEGDAAARNSAINIFVGGKPKISLGVDALLACFFHRIGLIRPDLRRVGFGHVVKNQRTIVVLDDRSGRERGKDDNHSPVVYPGEKATKVPLAFGGSEFPNPIPPEGKGKSPGYPITVTFPESARVTDASLVLEDARGASVPGWLSSPEKPAVKPENQKNSICLIPKNVLRTATTYQVKAQAIVDGKKWTRTWKFTTHK